MENSKIQWTHHTWNPYRGCSKVSPGCDHCYAEAMSGRNPGVLGVWGPEGTRVVASEAQWKLPAKWQKEAEAAGERRRVFCASLADVFEGWPGQMADSAGGKLWAGPIFRPHGGPHTHWWRPGEQGDPLDQCHVLLRLFDLIRRTPNLDWLLLTKRPQHAIPAIAAASRTVYGGDTDDTLIWLSEWAIGKPPANVWLGASVEDQQRADERIPALLAVPARIRFLSLEPLLGPVDLRPKAPDAYAILGKFYHTGTFDPSGMGPAADRVLNCFPKIDWVIVGGESGHHARPFDPAWARSLLAQCRAASVPYFCKQMGAAPVGLRLIDRKGGDWEELPDDLRVREFPKLEALS